MTSFSPHQQPQHVGLRRIDIEFTWTERRQVPITPYNAYPIYNETFEQHKCKIKVFAQGNLDNVAEEGKIVILTVHDIGKSYWSFVDFVNSGPMEAMKKKAVFVHICVPGQEPNAKDFKKNFRFPTMESLCHGLAATMKTLELAKCLVVGEGAGADIACRFAMEHPKYVTGLLLIHCTSTTHGIMENLKEILSNLVLEDGEMDQAAWNYLLAHRFGNHKMDEEQKKFIEHIGTEKHINLLNLSRFIYAFSNREDFTHHLKERLGSLPAILITGTMSAHNENVQHMFGNMAKSKTGLMIVPGGADVLEEAADYLAYALILLCHRNKLLMNVRLAAMGEGNSPKH